MAQIDKKAEIKKKRKIVYVVFSIILIILFLLITFPPIVQVFDRNDIWFGPFPLSQWYVFSVPLLAAISMAIMYFFDRKYTNQLHELNQQAHAEEGGNE